MKLTRENCALIVVDMQYDFLVAGCPSAAPAGMEIVPDLQRLLTAARASGLALIYTQESHRPTQRDYGIELEFEQPHCVEGTRGHDIIDELVPTDQDLIVSKRRYDAFFGTDLDLLLREIGVKNVIITGVCTDLCVLESAMHARNLDYRVWVPRECTQTLSEERRQAAFTIMHGFIAHVCSLDDVLMSLSNSGAQTSIEVA